MKIQAYNPIPNTFGLKVTAASYVEYDTPAELETLLADGIVTTPYLHVGSGSNLLFSGDYPGVILHSCIKGIEVLHEDASHVKVRVGAGVVWDDFVAHCVAHGWHGAENLSLIPGEVGAAAVQNIGAYGVEIKDIIAQVETVSLHGDNQTYSTEQCAYAYRDSLFKKRKDLFVTRVTFVLSKLPLFSLGYASVRNEADLLATVDLPAVRAIIIRIREAKLPDPARWGNAGSFFKNPVVERSQFDALHIRYPDMPFYEQSDGSVKIPAGWLIEQCGWKGKSLGRAAVYDKQALVLINCGGATGQDIIALSDAVRRSVREHFEIDITPEVNVV
ncbi:MAG: UDP-N-acetylmuramate dehydrogenase [Mediterranea sp.]|jgi:UDP-N-acetylmuramate dehydrogenase|nr:UDP-N-acetylmuramate dehydrogenase [Mediterranea sp.]